MPRSLLIVEDFPDALRMMTIIFRADGWDVRPAATVAEAMGLIDPPPDAALVDLMLPDGGGEEVVRALREAGAATRIVIYSATADFTRRREALALGADDDLTKPAGLDEMRAALRAIIPGDQGGAPPGP